MNRATGAPLWARFGLAGGALGIVGVGLVRAARERAAGVRLFSRSMEALGENLAWLKGGQAAAER